MKVAAVTPSDAASDPRHPDHDRWVKETTLKMEVEHAKRLGLPLSVAEAENLRLLQLTDRKAGGKRPELTKKQTRQKNDGHAARKDKRGVTKRALKPTVMGAHLSPCGRCGVCINCKRERRVAAMCVKANQGDTKFVMVLLRLWAYAAAAKGGTGQFANMNPDDANRMVIRRLEEVCDATIPTMGQWR